MNSYLKLNRNITLLKIARSYFNTNEYNQVKIISNAKCQYFVVAYAYSRTKMRVKLHSCNNMPSLK